MKKDIRTFIFDLSVKKKLIMLLWREKRVNKIFDRRTDRQTYRQTNKQKEAGQSDPYVLLFFADDPTMNHYYRNVLLAYNYVEYLTSLSFILLSFQPTQSGLSSESRQNSMKRSLLDPYEY